MSMPDHPQTIRVAIADDHPIVRTGLRWMFETVEGLELVEEASDGAAAIRLVGETHPDVMLLDLRMPGTGGLEALAQIHRSGPRLRSSS